MTATRLFLVRHGATQNGEQPCVQARELVRLAAKRVLVELVVK